MNRIYSLKCIKNGPIHNIYNIYIFLNQNDLANILVKLLNYIRILFLTYYL